MSQQVHAPTPLAPQGGGAGGEDATYAHGARHGSLKIFFGYAAGVGKTCAMLAAAHQARQAGVDVVAGYVEPHQRPETQTLLDGLEVLPPREERHGGALLREFDLDAALARRPRLLLVDEMAHTNAPGCRHRKRHQDIEELLRHGIDVYTTVNVQHVESLHDVVRSITGIAVRERVPDAVFDGADHVEMVDIEPEALLERLRQGKVYRPEQAQTALGNFFTPENLTALREVALRRTADIISRTVEKNKALHRRSDYFTNEHVLVCLSSSPSNPRVIRAAARMAGAFHGKFTALYVETSAPLSPENTARLDANARLAGQLGARLVSVEGNDVPWQVAAFAKAGSVSKIVMGRPGKERARLFRKGNFIDRITTLAPHLDVYVIPDQQQDSGGGPAAVPPRGKSPRSALLHPLGSSPRDLALCALFLAGSSALGLGFDALGFSEATVILAYTLAVLLTALCTSGFAAMLCGALGSVLAFNFLFTEPLFSFKVNDPGHLVTFAIMLLVSAVISSLTKRLQLEKTLVAQQAHSTALLLETSQKLQGARDTRQIISETGRQLAQLLQRPVIMYPVRHGRLDTPLIMDTHAPHTPATPDGTGTADTLRPDLRMGREERAVAEWCLRNRKPAGAGTDTLPGARCLHMCVDGQEGALAVAAVAVGAGAGNGRSPQKGDSPAAPSRPLDAFEKSLLASVLGECALALEKERIRESKDEAFVHARHEALRANMLRAISHDLRTPLTSISGNAQMLRDAPLSEETHRRLCDSVCEDAAWLTSLVENILAVTRLEDGSSPQTRLNLEAELVADCLREAVHHVQRRATGYSLRVRVEDEMLLARMDARLIMQVLVNMVDNALKYTPKGSEITVSAARRGNEAEITVADNGPGIPGGDREKLFDMFYTLPHPAADSRRGLGLGLYLCRAIVAAHGGHIRVEDNMPTGCRFIFTLPLEQAAPEQDHA